MAFIKKINNVSVFNEIIEREEFGDISPIINDKEKIIKNLPSDKTSFIFKNKTIDLYKISDSDYQTFLKDIDFKKILRKHFKDNSYFRQTVLKGDEVNKNPLSFKSFMKDKILITKLFKKLNRGIFKRTIIFDINGRLFKGVDNLTKDSQEVNEMLSILKANGYKDIIFEIGSCYQGQTLISISKAFEEIKEKYQNNKAMLDKIDNFINNLNKVYDNSYKIIFTIETRKVASQSTKVNWRSCMNLENGVFRQRIGASISAGLAAVYLVKVGDESKIQRPLARLLIKPTVFSEKTGTDFNIKNISDEDVHYYIDKTYTSNNSISTNINTRVVNIFEKKVKNILDKINNKNLKNLVTRENKPSITFNLQRDVRDGDDGKYYADAGVNKIVKDIDGMKIIKKISSNRADEQEIINYFKNRHNEEIIQLLIKNKKDELLNKIQDEGGLAYEGIKIDLYKTGRVPENIKIDTIELNAMDKEIKFNKNKILKANTVKYTAVDNIKNKLEGIDKDTQLLVNDFSYYYHGDEDLKFKITDNIKSANEIRKKELKEKDINLNIINFSNSSSTFKIEPKNFGLNFLKKAKINFAEKFDKNLIYDIKNADITFSRKTKDENSNFMLNVDKDSKISIFPEKYYLSISSKNLEQIKFLYENLLKILLKVQNDFLVNQYKKQSDHNPSMLKTIEKIQTLILIEENDREFVKNNLGIDFNNKQFIATLHKKTKDILPLNIYIMAFELFTLYNKNLSIDYINYLNLIDNIGKIYKIDINYINYSGYAPEVIKDVNDFVDNVIFDKAQIAGNNNLQYTTVGDILYINSIEKNKMPYIDLANMSNFSTIKVLKTDRKVMFDNNITSIQIDERANIINKKLIFGGKGAVTNFSITSKVLDECTIEIPVTNELVIKNSVIGKLNLNPQIDKIILDNSEINEFNHKNKNYDLNIINSKKMPNNVICKNLNIENSSFELTKNLIVKNIIAINSQIEGYRNINILKSFETFKDFNISDNNLTDVDNIPIIFKKNEYENKIKNLFKNENVFFIEGDSADGYGVYGELHNKIIDIIISRLNLKDLSRQNRDFIRKIGESLPSHISNKFVYNKKLDAFADDFEDIRKKVRAKKEELESKIKKAKPIGSMIKNVKEKIKQRFTNNDSFISLINDLEKQSYFD